jgi:Ca2+/Na+ antiporter
VSALEIGFEVLLSIFALVIIGLAAMTAIKVFRLRNKRLSWRAGTLAGYPLFSSIFLLISFTLWGVTCAYGSPWQIGAAAIYVIISCAWFTASYYSSKYYITDYGIVKNVNEPNQTVAWHQITDFFEQPGKTHTCFIFFYQSKNGSRIVRLPLRIPTKKVGSFQKLLAHKLGQRLNCFEMKGIDISKLEDI